MSLLPGVIVGTVKDVKDPDGQGRILVEHTWMGGKQGYWSAPATLMSGNGRGSWFMPEVGDEVLVAFDHGDSDHAYILGFLWNGQDKPPETDPRKRLIKSVKGHTILLDDSDNGEKIDITSSKSAKITIDDTNKAITIKSTKGHTILLDDSDNGEKIDITSSKNAKITIDDTNKAIIIATSGGLKITMDDAKNAITIEASQQVSVKASTVTLDANSINLGQGASHPSVHGDALLKYLNEFIIKTYALHTHASALGPTSPPVPPPPTPPTPALLSQIVKEA